jgi:hypothetical protein
MFKKMMEIDVLKKMCKTATQQDEECSWDEEDLDKLIVLYFKTFKIPETKIIKFICELKPPIRITLLATLLEKDILQITATWNTIINYSHKQSTFLKILKDAIDGGIPILLHKLDSAEVLEQVNILYLQITLMYDVLF